jgi:hypothetical protein
VQAAPDIQNKRFSQNGSTDIVCSADTRVGEDPPVLPGGGVKAAFDGAVMNQLSLSGGAQKHALKSARIIANLANALLCRPKLMLS